MRADDGSCITLFLGGDVMTGRGIDQILPHPSDPRIHEDCTGSARRYVELAEQVNGPIPAPVDFSYIWGDALAELAGVRPDVRIINLETSVTRSDDYWRRKGINYRMHPDNVPCLTVARIDCCVLANNHVLDYGYAGLRETLESLQRAGMRTAGAGRNRAEAGAPAVIEVADRGRVIVFGFGTETSGIRPSWAAMDDRPGVDLLEDLAPQTVARIGRAVGRIKRPRDIVVASIHWGDNWGFEVPRSHVRFAHELIHAGVDIVHGHSSHHVRPIELFDGRLILYGCGDLLTDYEGIGGHEELRPDLNLMYFPVLEPATGRLSRLLMTPMQMRKFQARRASARGARWLRDTIKRESVRFESPVTVEEHDCALELRPTPVCSPAAPS